MNHECCLVRAYCRLVLVSIALALAALVTGCEPPASKSTGQSDTAASGGNARSAALAVKLVLNWYPEAEHGGYYAALREGFYREQGLDVEIQKGGPDAPVVQLVAGGKVEFGISNADGLLLARAADAPVVAIMAPLQVSPRCIMVHEESGISSFDALRDITIAMNPSQPFYHYMRTKVPLAGVTIVPYQGSVAQFLEDKTFAQQAYVFSEPFVAREAGARPKALLLAELGFNPYTSVLFSTEGFVGDHPDVVRKMASASIRGWEHYLAHAEETNRYIHKINPEMGLKALAYGTKTLKPLVLDKVARRHGVGHMSLARWRELASQLVEAKQLKQGAVRVEDAFTTEFVLTKEKHHGGTETTERE